VQTFVVFTSGLFCVICSHNQIITEFVAVVEYLRIQHLAYYWKILHCDVRSDALLLNLHSHRQMWCRDDDGKVWRHDSVTCL